MAEFIKDGITVELNTPDDIANAKKEGWVEKQSTIIAEEIKNTPEKIIDELRKGAESSLGGALQGLTFGQYPKIAGAPSEAINLIAGSRVSPYDIQGAENYYKELKEQAPGAYGAGEIVGSMIGGVPKLASGLALKGAKPAADFLRSKLLPSVAEGLSYGIGQSDDNAKEAVAGGAIGAGIGAAFPLVGKKLAKPISEIGKRALQAATDMPLDLIDRYLKRKNIINATDEQLSDIVNDIVANKESLLKGTSSAPVYSALEKSEGTVDVNLIKSKLQNQIAEIDKSKAFALSKAGQDAKQLIEEQIKYIDDVAGASESRGVKLYHGTDKDFEKFVIGKTPKSGSESDAVFFTDNKDVAKTYGNKIKEFNVDLKSPLTIDFDGKSTVYFDGKWRSPSQLSKRISEINSDLKKRYRLSDDLLEELEQYGWNPLYSDTIDGAILKNIDDMGSFGDKPINSTVYLVSDLSKINKSSGSIPVAEVKGIVDTMRANIPYKKELTGGEKKAFGAIKQATADINNLWKEASKDVPFAAQKTAQSAEDLQAVKEFGYKNPKTIKGDLKRLVSGKDEDFTRLEDFTKYLESRGLGTDALERAKDAEVRKFIDSSSRQGSRNVNAGIGIMGGLGAMSSLTANDQFNPIDFAGRTLGGIAAGATGGYLRDTYGGKIAKTALDAAEKMAQQNISTAARRAALQNLTKNENVKKVMTAIPEALQ